MSHLGPWRQKQHSVDARTLEVSGLGNFLAVQWLGLGSFTVVGMIQSLAGELGSTCRIPPDTQSSEKKKKERERERERERKRFGLTQISQTDSLLYIPVSTRSLSDRVGTPHQSGTIYVWIII